MQYICLLRGINVGGNNLIKMADLKSVFEEMGFQKVQTYIQSGNLIFNTPEKNSVKLEKKIEQVLSAKFQYPSKVVIVSGKSLANLVANAPDDFGAYPNEFRYDVLFLKQPLTPSKALEKVIPREGVDRVYPGEGVLYFSRLISKAGQSYLNKIVGTTVYKEMTVRNWNTTRKLLEKCAEE